MKLLACAVFDKQVGAYNNPQYFRSRGEAIRAFMDAVRDKNTQFAAHPEDYVFMQCGEFSTETGLFVSKSSGPEVLISALECVDR